MALNVNIIGRDSEGNLQALKVNSEGNLEISDKDFATESTLSIIKDNQGRLYGKYDEEWLPILVDSTGRLLLASDVTVNAEGLTVDLGQIKQGPAGTEPWPVQLSGTTVETILDRTFDISKDYGDASYHRRWVTSEGPARWSTTLPAHDISRYKKLTIVVVNETSAEVKLSSLGAADTGVHYYFTPGPVGLAPWVEIGLPNVPAGATAMWYEEMEGLDLAENFTGMGLLFSHDITELTSGTVRFIICGVKR